MKAGLEVGGVGGIYLGYHGNFFKSAMGAGLYQGHKGKARGVEGYNNLGGFFVKELFRFRRTQGRTSFHVCTILREGYFNLDNSSDRIESNPSSLIPGTLK